MLWQVDSNCCYVKHYTSDNSFLVSSRALVTLKITSDKTSFYSQTRSLVVTLMITSNNLISNFTENDHFPIPTGVTNVTLIITSDNSLHIPHRISRNANFPTNSSWSFSCHVNCYLWQLSLKILEGMLFAPIKFSERYNVHGILFDTVPGGHSCSPVWAIMLLPSEYCSLNIKF